MTDRELLELAAKAAGFDEPKYFYDKNLGREIFTVMQQSLCTWWDPLTNDADALRLAVKLTLELDICLSGIAVRTPCGHKILVNADDFKCGYEATRRAIVTAAAEIGKKL